MYTDDFRLLAAVVNSTIDSVLITTSDVEDPIIVYVNPAWTKMAGYSAKEVVGNSPRILQGPRTDRALLARLKNCLRTGQVFEGMSFNYRKDGTEFYNEWHIEPVIHPDGTTTHFLAIQRDVTERELMQKQMMQNQKMESMGLMAGGIAHDFNNILNMVLGFGEIALRKMTPEMTGFRELTRIVEAGAKGVDLTKRLLQFSRQEAHVYKSLQLNGLISDTVKLFERIFPKNIKMQLAFEPNLPEIVADAGQIEQIVMNTAINARDAMPKGGTLKITTSRHTALTPMSYLGIEIPPGDYVRLDVADSGEGMSEATRANLFRPFFTTKEAGKGTGLGLSIVRAVVKRHNGAVDVASELGRGTTFSFFFPPRREAARVPPNA